MKLRAKLVSERHTFLMVSILGILGLLFSVRT